MCEHAAPPRLPVPALDLVALPADFTTEQTAFDIKDQFTDAVRFDVQVLRVLCTKWSQDQPCILACGDCLKFVTYVKGLCRAVLYESDERPIKNHQANGLGSLACIDMYIIVFMMYDSDII